MTPTTPVKFVLGTHTMGDSSKDAWVSFDSIKDVEAVLDAFQSRGYTEIDTGRNYGASEARLGQAGAASRFTVHTKVRSGQPGDLEPAKIALSIEESLNALKTSSVETMYLHVPDRQTPLEDTAKAMNDALQQGKFKKLGLSNYSAAEVKQYIDICEKNGYAKPSMFQGHYNPLVRGGEEELFPLLHQHNIAFVAYSPAAGGFFSGNTENSNRWSGDNPIAKNYQRLYGAPAVKASVATVHDAAKKHGIDGHAAAIRWTAFHSALDGKYGDAVILGISKLEHVHKNLDALEAGPLPAALAEALTAVYATLEGEGPGYHL